MKPSAMEDEVLANSGVDIFEEVFKLIFTKIYDEMESGRNQGHVTLNLEITEIRKQN